MKTTWKHRLTAMALGAYIGLLIGCGGLAIRQSSMPGSTVPPGATNDMYIPNPAYVDSLKAVQSSGLPYVSEAAAALLAILSGYVAVRNRKLKNTAIVLTENVTALKPTPEEISIIKGQQEKAGVRDEIKKLL